jgi:hypothetical protein
MKKERSNRLNGYEIFPHFSYFEDWRCSWRFLSSFQETDQQGNKYIEDSLFYKLANNAHKIYPDEEKAAKVISSSFEPKFSLFDISYRFLSQAAGHELKSLNAIARQIIGAVDEAAVKDGRIKRIAPSVSGIYIPLIFLVDYCGFRFVIYEISSAEISQIYR